MNIPTSATNISQQLEEIAALVDTNSALALEKLKTVAEAGSQDQRTDILSARALIRLECYLKAAGFAGKAIERGGISQEAFALWLHALSNGGDYAGMEIAVNTGFSLDRMQYRNLLAMAQVCRLLGMSEKSIRFYNLLIENRPADAALYSRLGVVYQSIGDTVRAESNFQTAIEKDRTAVQAYYLLSCARKQTPEKNNLALLSQAWQEAQKSPQADAKQVPWLAYAQGKEHEDLEDYQKAFTWYQRGAQAVRSTISYSTPAEKEFFDQTKASFSQLSTGKIDGYEDDDPIFVVGMPRTGSTLIDTMLSRHSRVFAPGELNSFREALKEQSGFISGRGTLPQYLASQKCRVDFKALGRRYISLARTSKFEGLRFTDKMPGNHALLGFIALALPRARFICTERAPADVCMSNYKQFFASGSYNYSYTLEETAKHCLMHRNMTNFWLRHFLDRILEVSYEQLVAETEGTVTKILKFCGLEWERNCLDFNTTSTPVNTASSAQVRQPIYRSSVEKWRFYEKELQPALDVLKNDPR